VNDLPVNQSDAVDTPDYALFLDAPFSGTGEVLTWDTEAIFNALNTDRLFRDYWGAQHFSDVEYAQQKETLFDPAFTALRSEIISQSLLQVRALYAFFPVFTEHDSLVVLCPSDNSTQRTVLHLPPHIINAYTPEGDLGVFFAFSLGSIEVQIPAGAVFDNNRAWVSAFLTYCHDLMTARMATEIRKSLLLTPVQGRPICFTTPLFSDNVLAAVVDLLGAEDRIASSPNQNPARFPGRTGLFVHRLAA
jgi:hypothetical protein